MIKRILIVDDSDSIREVISFTLCTGGYEVIMGINGRDALKHLDGSVIDLIITDLYMPEMDGISFIREVRYQDLYKKVPIMFLTTESQKEKKAEAREAGATGWIIKPFVPSQLLDAINKVIR